jgi:SAM-dependent methyltransferase
MDQWTDGYVTGLDYTYEHHADLNPIRVPLTLIHAGLAPPEIHTACELGFGQGISANLHAAGSTVEWYGTDFNPAHAAFARGMAAVSGARAKFFDQSFVEFCSRSDLPDFDFIAMHGVWSWINEDNRAVLVDFLRRKLTPGGVAYMSYNLQPGFAAMVPLREVLRRHTETQGTAGRGLGDRIDRAVNFADKLLGVSPAYVDAHPQLPNWLQGIKSGDRSYLAHEYFNRDWAPTSFSRLAEQLAAAKLEHAANANYISTVDAWNFTSEQQALLNEIEDAAFRETVRDFISCRTFRIDYWVKGARRLTPLEKLEALLRQRLMLVKPREEVPAKIVANLGEFPLLESICAPILEALADHQPRSVREIGQAVRERRIDISRVMDVLMTYVRLGAIAPVQDDIAARSAKIQTDRLNAHLCDAARIRPDFRFLASPVIGTGFAEAGGRMALHFLHAMSQGKKHAGELAAHASQILQLQGLAIMREGKPLESPEETLQSLNAQAGYFLDKQLPVLKALQVV